MQPPAEQLVVRQHERFHCRLSLHLRVGDEAGEQVVLARTAGDGTGAVDATITDTSRGGMGIESAVFFPRGCRLKARIKRDASGRAPEKDMMVRVQRVSMLDRKPTYYLGVSFVGKGPEHEQAVALLLDMARQQDVGAPAPIRPAVPADAGAGAKPTGTPGAPGAPPPTGLSTATGRGGR